jgi:hypothetical protein
MATFEAWDPAGRSFDAVIAAQSSPHRNQPSRRPLSPYQADDA